MTRVLGVDPGSSATGWGVVVGAGTRLSLVDHGVVRPGRGDRSERLAVLAERFATVVRQAEPDCAAVESSFAGRNPRSSLQLAESRGVLLAVLGQAGVPVHAYSPAEVKTSIVGHGRAEKQQIVYMVVRLLGLDSEPPRDAADAIAVALTHLQSVRWRCRT